MDNPMILVIASHPDDELLGCGATVYKFVKQGARAVSLILGEGLTARDQHTASSALASLKQDARKANAIIGVDDLHFENFPDNQFDTVPILTIAQMIEGYITRYSPDVIFTHFGNDLNVDHRCTFQAVMTACRPQPGFKHPDIYCFEIPSSTDYAEFSADNAFIPNVHFDISEEAMNVKLQALTCYRTEMREYPHARSLDGIKVMAQHRGIKVGLRYAEAFVLMRKIVGAGV